MEYEAFHIVAVKATSDQLLQLLQAAGVRVKQQVTQETGYTEYLILVHSEDMGQAQKVFVRDLGRGTHRTFSADGNK